MVRYAFVDKIVLVTGSSRGMGTAILEGFAAAGTVCIVNYFADADGHNRRDADETAERLRRHGVSVAEAGVAGPGTVCSVARAIDAP
jgi:NAD(P)-dependent dehydrogenase (short-subunit alcohol dehydrogenase family)